MTDTATTTRCPSCGGAMERIATPGVVYDQCRACGHINNVTIYVSVATPPPALGADSRMQQAMEE